MARARNIKPGLFKNELLGSEKPDCMLLFIGLWTLADRRGILEDRPARIKAELFPYREGVDVNGYLTVLERLGFIQRFRAKGKALIHIENFKKHQTPHHTERPSDLPGIEEKDEEKQTDAKTTVNAPLEHRETQVSERSDSLIPDSLIHRFTDSGGEPPYPPVALRLVQNVEKVDEPVKNKPPTAEKPVNQKTDNVTVVFEYWRKRLFHEGAKLDNRTRRRIQQALNLGYTVENLCSAIDGCSESPFHMGKNENHMVYDGLRIILRDAEQIDKFMTLASGAESARAVSG